MFGFFFSCMLILFCSINSIDSVANLCSEGTATKIISKVTTDKFFLCAMFRDEVGYLAEFVAYYKVHGFDHIILWNHESSDNYIDELLPWIKSGYVEVINTTTIVLDS